MRHIKLIPAVTSYNLTNNVNGNYSQCTLDPQTGYGRGHSDWIRQRTLRLDMAVNPQTG